MALSSQRTVDIAGSTRHGHVYIEHDPSASAEEREKALWAALDNDASFWFTEPSLMNMLASIGFTSLLDVLAPTMPASADERQGASQGGVLKHIPDDQLA